MSKGDTGVSLEVLRGRFLEALQLRGYAASSLRTYEGSLKVFFRFLNGRAIRDVREVDREVIRGYALWLGRERFPDSGPYAIQSRHVHLKTIRRFFEYLEQTDAILINPCTGIRLPKLEDRLPRTILSAEEVRRMLDGPDTGSPGGIRDRAILELFYSTGIRLEEMTRLRIHDVDFENGLVRVTKGKFARDRVVPCGDGAARCVREYMENVRATWIAAPWDGICRIDHALWLSSRRPHAPLESQTIQVMVKQYARAVGIERPITPHVWRHTCATDMVGNGADLMQVKQLLGHRSLKTTQIYTRVTVSEVQATHRCAHPRAGRSHS